MTEVMGVVNRTTNFILTKMTQEGMEFKDAWHLQQNLDMRRLIRLLISKVWMQDVR